MYRFFIRIEIVFKECGIGRYRLKCGESCKHCLEDIWNNVNGICTKGCESGYKTNMCNTRM